MGLVKRVSLTVIMMVNVMGVAHSVVGILVVDIMVDISVNFLMRVVVSVVVSGLMGVLVMGNNWMSVMVHLVSVMVSGLRV